MGNPLAPLLAEAFMANFEEKMFSSDASQQKPIKYCRYVDDTFALFKNENDSLKFLSVLNSQHPAIRFTIEPQKEHKLPFLDVEIIFDGNTITTRPYRKPTFTGKLLNFKWIVPKSWKVGLIKNMIHRIWLTSSTWKVFCEEVETLTDILTFNEYPKWLIFRNIRKIVTDYYHNTGRDNQKDKEDISHVIKLQYLGKASDRLKTSLLKIFKKYQINNTACIFNTKHLYNIFPIKDKTPNMLQSCVIYKYTCLRDLSLSYYGKTHRHLITRIMEHKKTNNESAVNDHLLQCSSCTLKTHLNQFEIINQQSNKLDTAIAEALFIKRDQPKLNKQLFKKGSCYILKLFN